MTLNGLNNYLRLKPKRLIMNNRLATSSFLPSSAVLEMTYSCNHQCLFCSCPWEHAESNYHKGNELTLEQWKACIDKLAHYGATSFSYTGGEPFLNKNIEDIILYVNSLKVNCLNSELEFEEKTPNQFLISNGQLINESRLDFIKQQHVNLSMSLPGLRTYFDHTRNGSCDKILTLFSKAKERGINTTVNITVTKKNLFELRETISNALLAGANTLLLNRFLPGGRGMSHTQELLLDKDETIEMLLIAEDVLKKANRFGSVGTELPICLIKDIDFKHLSVGTRCAAGVEFFVVGPEGVIRTCNHSPIQLDTYEQIENLKKNKYWQTFTQKRYLPESCTNCSLTNCCDGGCREAAHIFTGDLRGNDPIFSRM